MLNSNPCRKFGKALVPRLSWRVCLWFSLVKVLGWKNDVA